MAVKDWSTTAGSNSGILSGITLDGAVMTPPQVDNAFRDMAAQIASQLGKVGYKGADVASAATTDLATASGWFVDITGTTTITAFGTVDAGQMFLLQFDGILTLTYNASSLVLPGAASIVTTAGDVAIMVSEGSGNWRCVHFTRSAGFAPTLQAFTADGTWTKPAGCRRIVVEAVGGGGGAGGSTGAASNWNATGGGGSGAYGHTAPIDVTAISSGTVVIGPGGAGGAAGNNNGTNGTATTILLGATTYTWPGGDASPGGTANLSAYRPTTNGVYAGAGTNVITSSNCGDHGWSSVTDTDAMGGAGAPSPFGDGASRVNITTTGGAEGNDATANTGGGGGGCCTGNEATDRSGGDGGSGYMRVWEYY